MSQQKPTKQKYKPNQKQIMVNEIFTNVANKYNLMNDIMSFGMHRVWKKQLINQIYLKPEENIIDVGGGTGDIAKYIRKKYTNNITICDINMSMIVEGMQKLINANKHQNTAWVCANAENLPYQDNSFNYYINSFTIRNVTNYEQMIKEAYRILKPKGIFLCLEFTQKNNITFNKLYNLYARNFIPLAGKIIANNANAYQYLVDSIESFLNADQLLQLLQKNNFKNTSYHKLNYGIAAIHRGTKHEKKFNT